MIDNNNINKIEPEFVFFISPITNPLKRKEYFTSLINNKKITYHHKDFKKILLHQDNIFGSSRNLRYQSRYINKFNTKTKIIMVLENDNVFSNKIINDKIINNKNCFTYITENISKYGFKNINDLIDDILTSRFIIKKIE
tara:strand:- start:93 stop:512 length:420 start_codon:yes stop_codon:yes gene_type:complete